MKKMTQRVLKVAIALFTATTFGQITTAGNWKGIGDVEITTVTDDNDNGDGVNDGALFVRGLSAAVGQGIAFQFHGTMENGANYNITSNVYNFKNSFVRVKVSLHNVTDDVELVASNAITINTKNQEELYTLNYTAQASDSGDQLEIRFVRTDDGNTARRFTIDNANLGGVQVVETPLPINTEGTWSEIGDVTLADVTDDADNGDGAGDGALLVNGQSSVVGQGAKFTFGNALLEEGVNYSFHIVTFNNGGSFSRIAITLHNITDDTELARVDNSGNGILLRSIDPPVTTDFNYTATATDVGDEFELRFTRVDDGLKQRDFKIDIVELNNNAVQTTVTLSNANLKIKEGIQFNQVVTDQLTFNNLHNIHVKSVSLIHSTGGTVYNNNDLSTIDTSSLAQGLYILTITSADGLTITEKIIKQ